VKILALGVQYKSDYEREFAEYLQLKKLIGEIREYEYEPYALELAPFNLASDKTPTVYTPDFVVVNAEGKREIYEVKGYMWSRDSVRLRWAADKYRDEYDFFLVTKVTKGKLKGNWKIKQIGKYNA